MSRLGLVKQVNPAGERGRTVRRLMAAPEGATAPETLRDPDRGGMNTLESAEGALDDAQRRSGVS